MPPLRVLFVDDNALLRELVTELLYQEGLEVVAAAHADEALTALAAGSFDVLVVDDQMPGLSGRGLLRRIRAEGSRIAAVIYSGTVALADEERRQLGVHCVVAKPARTVDLLAAIRGAAGAD